MTVMVTAPAAACASGAGAVGATAAAALTFFAASQCLLREPWPRHDHVINGTRFDFIVVGGGTAGSTLAARLAEVAHFTVLLVEAGPDPPQESIVPGFKEALLGSSYDWNFTTVDDARSSQALSGGRQRQPRGKMLGGSGSINNMIYARGFPADYDEWAALAGDAWSWENVLPYFKKTEHMTDRNIVNNPELMRYHGTGGEIEVTGYKENFFHVDRFLEAFKEIGFSIVDDMTYPHKTGAGSFSHTIKEGRRASSLTALLNKVKGDNLVVLKNALVSKILIEEGRAVGVKVLTAEDEVHFYADKEVVVTAGTFNTAKLLLLSGIGPKEHLHEMGVDVVADLPVGDNFHDHVMYLNYIVAENGTCATSEASQHMSMIQYLYDGSGWLSRADSMGALLALRGSEPNTPDFAFYPTCVPVNSGFYEGCISVIGFDHEICAQLDAENQNSELLSVAVVLLKPKSRGAVRLNSLDPFDDPLIYSGTFDDPEDLEGYPEAVDVVHSLAETGYFKSKGARVVDFKLKVCAGLREADEVKCEAMAMAMSAWHAVGTAAMGRVLEGDLAVRGVSALRVADASAVPAVVRGNTNAPVVMLAEKAADFIKARYGPE